MQTLSEEPVVLATIIVALVQAFITLGQEFSYINWTPEQIGAVLTLVTLAVSVARFFVTPVSKIERLKKEGKTI